MNKVFLTLVLSTLFSAYGMDNNSTGLAFECDAAPTFVVKNSSQNLVRAKLKKSYAKWFYSLHPAVQAKIQVAREANLYSQTRVNDYLKKTCLHAAAINPSISKLKLEEWIDILSNQIEKDSIDYQAVKSKYETLLNEINTSTQPTLRQLNKSQAYALQMQKYEDRMEFTSWQLKKAESFIGWQARAFKRLQRSIDQKFSSLPGSQYITIGNNTLVRFRNEAKSLNKKLSKRLGMLKNARNKQQTLKALEFLEDIRRKLYLNGAQQEIIKKKIRLGPNRSIKQSLELPQQSEATPSSETIPPEIAEIHELITQADAAALKELLELTPEDEAIMAQHLQEIKNKPGAYAEFAQFLNKHIDRMVDGFEKNIAPCISAEGQAKLIVSGLEHLLPEMSESERAAFQENLAQIIKQGRRLAGLPNEKVLKGILKGTANIAKKVITDPVGTIILPPGKMVLEVGRLIKDGSELRAKMLYYHLTDPEKCRQLADKYFNETVDLANTLYKQLEYIASLSEEERAQLGTEIFWETYLFHQSATAQARLAKWMMIKSAQQAQNLLNKFKKPNGSPIILEGITIESSRQEFREAARRALGRDLKPVETEIVDKLFDQVQVERPGIPSSKVIPAKRAPRPGYTEVEISKPSEPNLPVPAETKQHAPLSDHDRYPSKPYNPETDASTSGYVNNTPKNVEGNITPAKKVTPSESLKTANKTGIPADEIAAQERWNDMLERAEQARKNTEAAWAATPGLEKTQRISWIESDIINAGINHNIKHYLRTENFAGVLEKLTVQELRILDKALRVQRHNKKFFERTGPLGKIIKGHQQLKAAEPYQVPGIMNNIQGAFAEAEVGYIHPGCIECEVKVFKKGSTTEYVTFDWKTVANEYLEVKDINWSNKTGEDLKDIFKGLIDKGSIAQEQNGKFIVYSKQPITEAAKRKFITYKIIWKLID